MGVLAPDPDAVVAAARELNPTSVARFPRQPSEHPETDPEPLPPDPALAAKSFSGGNQQKIVLAREIERNPDLLLVGQPTRGVDIGAIDVHAFFRGSYRSTVFNGHWPSEPPIAYK